jgi:hypothetical protein
MASIARSIRRTASWSPGGSVLLLGIGTILRGLAHFLLMGESRELWAEHTAGRGKDPLWLGLVGLLVAASIGALTAPYSLSESMGLHIASFPELFLGAVTATLVGGVLIATCRRILALLLVAVGVDVERTWLDEVLGIPAGGLILHHLGADLVAIGLFALSDLIPGLVQTLLVRLHPSPPPDDAVTHAPAVALERGRLASDPWPAR